MAKKSGKNIHKLLKKKQLQQLKENTPVSVLESATKDNQPELSSIPDLKKLPPGEGKPVLKTVIISAAIILVIFAITYFAKSSDYIENFGNWLYESLKLGKAE